jgi:hypothetical protein
MLAYILAIAVALGSFVFYIAAFFFPEVHRKYDFLWSGVGLFYALVLWICAGRITGGVLLGQAASVSLLGWLGWQTLTLRRTTSPTATQTEISPEVEEKAKGFPASVFAPLLNRFRKPKPSSSTATPVESIATLVDEAESEAEALLNAAGAPGATAAGGVEAEETFQETEPESNSQDLQVVSTEPQEEIKVDSNELGEETETEIEVETSETPYQPTPPNSPSAEMIDNAQLESEVEETSGAATPIEEFAPEAELAPPAEPHREQE